MRAMDNALNNSLKERTASLLRLAAAWNVRRRTNVIGAAIANPFRQQHLGIWSFVFGAFSLSAQPFHLPTANHALFEKGGEERFFVGTVGKPWTTGMFGCVRNEGWQMHERLDIRSLQRDKHGEPTDPVMATADGTRAYINTRPSLSNYGNYIVLR